MSFIAKNRLPKYSIIEHFEKLKKTVFLDFEKLILIVADRIKNLIFQNKKMLQPSKSINFNFEKLKISSATETKFLNFIKQKIFL